MDTSVGLPDASVGRSFRKGSAGGNFEPSNPTTNAMKRMMMRWLLAACLGPGSLMAQTLSPEQLKADFARFRTALAEVHPGQYLHTPKPRFDSLLAATERQLERPMTKREFYRTMVPVVAALRCGHTKWLVPGQDQHYPFDTTGLFPLKLYFVGERAWIQAAYGQQPVPKGAEVLSINGRPVAELVRYLLPNITFADGETSGGKYHELNHYFPGYYATFVETPESFTVQYRLGGEEQTARLKGVDLATIEATEKTPAPGAAPWRLAVKEGAAVLTIERFWLGREDKMEAKTFLEETFTRLRQQGIRKLVLDLRENEGGEENLGVLLYSYLISEPSPYYDRIEVRQKKKYSFPVWMPKMYRLGKPLVVRRRGDGYVFTHQKGLRTVRPQRQAFDGTLVVLVNGSSFSVTTELAARLHATGRATFVGEETGGGYASNNSGIFAITSLPQSGLILGLPIFGFRMAGVKPEFKHRGIVPQVPVVPTIEDRLSGRDPVLEAGMKLLMN